ncbi:hypothetical protein L9F63_001537 [Diploptera punctata]|uniref:Ataxin-10 n=1 Tax=Diploptera punctata TaxID=6984 RepID=A0AAD8A3E1_DIPPU|nr:hypothetical protein L9F63_001537 [Diploptera punctata]
MEGNANTNVESVDNQYEYVNSLLINKKWPEIIPKVANISRAFSDEENRKNISTHLLKNLNAVLEVSIKELKTDDVEVTVLVTEVFRALRNSCVGESANQILIINMPVVDNTCDIVKFLLKSNNEDSVLCLRIAVQFLGNLIVSNAQTQRAVWNKCCKLLLNLVKHEDNKVANYSCMVIYNILLGCPDITPAVEDSQLLEILIQLAENDSEFALFTVELLLSRPGYVCEMYRKVDVKHRLFLLDCIYSMITSSSKTSVPTCAITFLANEFKTHSDCILKTCSTYVDKLEPAEVSKLLQLLASACADSTHQVQLQNDKSLLINCAVLLKNIHSLGKSGENNFSVIQKMSDLSIATQDTDIVDHPAFGFKSSLIQMLANLCWKHLDNQNEIRELDCISVLLDCCNIDARNPLIIQWVVFAMRNLCENNLANQAVVAGMTMQGVVDSSVLLEMGLSIHEDEQNKIILLPLEKKNMS